jgi:hypothetical protein
MDQQLTPSPGSDPFAWLPFLTSIGAGVMSVWSMVIARNKDDKAALAEDLDRRHREVLDAIKISSMTVKEEIGREIHTRLDEVREDLKEYVDLSIRAGAHKRGVGGGA